jgi:hypothetical protein
MDARPHDYRAGYPAGDLRVSDAERDSAVSELSEHFQAGRLTLDEFQDRSAQALAARTGRQLRGLFVDLPPAGRPRTAPAIPNPTATFSPDPIAARNRARGFRGVVLAPVLLCVAIAAIAGGHQGAHPLARAIIPAIIVLLVVTRVARRASRRIL